MNEKLKGGKTNGAGKIAAFCCYHSAYEAADAAGSMHLQLPEGVRLIRVPCTGRVDIIHLINSVGMGYDGVLVLGCHEENCKFLRGNLLAKKRVRYANELLKEAGISGKMVEFHSIAANQPHRLIEVVKALRARLVAGETAVGKEGNQKQNPPYAAD